MSDAEARMREQDAYDLIEEQFNQELDESLGPAGPGELFRYVAEMALPAGALAVDAGCGEGEHAIELAIRFGLKVTGVHPVPRCVRAAQRSTPTGCPPASPLARRDPERYIARFGRQNYDIKLGDCLWHIYRMIGKLSGHGYLLAAVRPD